MTKTTATEALPLVSPTEQAPANQAPKRDYYALTVWGKLREIGFYWGDPNQDPDATVQTFNVLNFSAQEKGGKEMWFVPSLFNFAKSMANGDFYSAKSDKDLAKGKGEIAKALRHLEKLKKELKKEGLSDDKIQDHIQYKALFSQVAYLREHALKYVQWRLADTILSRDELETKKSTQGASFSKDDAKKLEGLTKEVEALSKDYISVLKREAEFSKQTQGKEFNWEERCILNRDGEGLAKGFVLGNAERVSQQASQPGIFCGKELTFRPYNEKGERLNDEKTVWLDGKTQAYLELEDLTLHSRGKHLPYYSLIPPLENPDHIVAGMLYFVGGTQSKEFRHPGLPAGVEKLSVMLSGRCTRMLSHDDSKREFQKFRLEKFAVPLGFVLGTIYAVGAMALTAVFMLALATPLGWPVAAIAAIAILMFLGQWMNGHDDFAGRAKRITGPLLRMFSGTVFDPDGHSLRTSEKFSTVRALVAGIFLLIIGVDLTVIGAGAALGFKEFFQNQPLLAKIHPVGILVTLVAFAVMSVISMITPRSFGFFARAGMAFKQPDAEKVDVRKWEKVWSQDPAVQVAREHVAETQADENSVRQAYNDDRAPKVGSLNESSASALPEKTTALQFAAVPEGTTLKVDEPKAKHTALARAAL